MKEDMINMVRAYALIDQNHIDPNNETVCNANRELANAIYALWAAMKLTPTPANYLDWQ